MLIKQISVFLENQKGKFAEIARLLGNAGINMRAFTVSESQDFGIARIIVSKEQTDQAFELIKSSSYAVTMTQVVYLECNDVPGAMANAMEQLSNAGISIEYMYAFADTSGDFSRVIIRPDRIDEANQIIEKI